MTLPVRVTAAVSLLLFLILLGLSLQSGVSQQWFEGVHPLPEYADRLVTAAAPLRTLLAVDDLFIAAYVLATLALVGRLPPGLVRSLVVGCVLTAGALDLVENHHLLALLADPTPTATEVSLQMIASSTKWVIAHLAFVALGTLLRPRTMLDRAFVFALVFVQLPVGVLVWTYPSLLVYWTRALNLAVGFGYLAVRGDAVSGATDAPG